MTFKEKRDHKFKLLFMCYFNLEDIENTMSNYFENYPYDEDNENDYLYGDKAHVNVAKIVLNESNEGSNESDKAITITPTDEDNIIDIKNKVRDILDKTNEIDTLISSNLANWNIKRVGKAELTIIRLAVYEMYYDDSIDVRIAINEAVELGKVYGEDKASKFINGVLSTIYKNKRQ